MTDTVLLSVNDAPPMNAYVFRPVGDGPFPAVMLFQEAFGVNNHIRNVAQRIADEGYLVIAPELFHRTAPAGFESTYDFSLVTHHYNALDTDKLLADVMATYDWLQTQADVLKDKIGSIGFCLGGRVSFLANSAVQLAGAVSFYGGYTHTLAGRAATLSAPHLFFWGGKDRHILPQHIQTVKDALTAADKDFINVEISYADHGFFCDERAAYHPQAATEAWGMTKEFLANKLG